MGFMQRGRRRRLEFGQTFLGLGALCRFFLWLRVLGFCEVEAHIPKPQPSREGPYGPVVHDSKANSASQSSAGGVRVFGFEAEFGGRGLGEILGWDG